MDEVYRGYRIAIRQDDKWIARITHVRGHVVPGRPQASALEGPEMCLKRARVHVDRYVEFLKLPDADLEG
ncbi:hypothetical protein [Devosia sp.]|uniref:hypothetical protein n=1 Tax=Devosia sp. TaxID=1871048 RepID=UPI003A8CB109